MSSDINNIRSLYDGAKELIYDNSVYIMSESFEQDCRRYSRALTDEGEVSAR